MDSLLGFAGLAASLGPGYMFERVAERHRPRVQRSALVETVELVVTGATFTLLAALIVLAVAAQTRWLNAEKLLTHTSTYLGQHSIAVVLWVAILYGLSFGGAWATARLAFRGKSQSVDPAATPWHRTFFHGRPTNDAGVFVTAYLRDGTEFGGFLSAYTLEPDDNREIALVKPLVIRRDGRAETLDDDFMVLREDDVGRIVGRYVLEMKRPASKERWTQLRKLLRNWRKPGMSP